jgi:hypothetical protein
MPPPSYSSQASKSATSPLTSCSSFASALTGTVVLTRRWSQYSRILSPRTSKAQFFELLSKQYHTLPPVGVGAWRHQEHGAEEQSLRAADMRTSIYILKWRLDWAYHDTREPFLGDGSLGCHAVRYLSSVILSTCLMLSRNIDGSLDRLGTDISTSPPTCPKAAYTFFWPSLYNTNIPPSLIAGLTLCPRSRNCFSAGILAPSR